MFDQIKANDFAADFLVWSGEFGDLQQVANADSYSYKYTMRACLRMEAYYAYKTLTFGKTPPGDPIKAAQELEDLLFIWEECVAEERSVEQSTYYTWGHVPVYTTPSVYKYPSVYDLYQWAAEPFRFDFKEWEYKALENGIEHMLAAYAEGVPAEDILA